MMKRSHETKYNKLVLMISFVLILVCPILSSSESTYTTIIYFKTNGHLKEINHLDSRNNFNIIQNYTSDDLIVNDNNSFVVEIMDSFYGDKIEIKLDPQEDITDFRIGFLVKIEDIFFEIQDQELTITENLDCSQENTSIVINETYSKEIKYCKNTVNSEEIVFSINIPFNKYLNCYESCTECSNFGNESNHNCLKCNNIEGYYFKENDNSQNCFTNITIDKGYFLEEENEIFKKCNQRCLNCLGPNETDCISCNNTKGYFFKESNINNICYSENEIEEGYYIDYNLNLFKRCNEQCQSCNQSEDNCILCNITKGYYFKEDDNTSTCYSENNIEDGYYLDLNENLIKKCYERCLTCNESYANCIKCINDEFHFDPIIDNHCIKEDELPSQNYYLDVNEDRYKICHEACINCTGPNINDCIFCNNSNGYYLKEGDNTSTCYSEDNIEEGYYLDLNDNLIKICYERCKSCNESGNETFTNCIKCIENEFHFDPIIENHCITEDELSSENYFLDINEDRYKICHEACINCTGPNTDDCILCNNSNGYYYKEDDNTLNCYSKDSIEDGYYLDLDDSLFKKCYERCLSCNESGNESYTNCIKCLNNEFHFDPIIENHCIKEDELPDVNYYVDIDDDTYKLCHETCLNCSGPNETDCISCNNSKHYYFKEDDEIKVCHHEDEIQDGYYLDLNENLIKNCNWRCFSCNQSGTNSYSNCLKCINDSYHFDPYKENHCINEIELPSINYYVDEIDNKYKICHERCQKCSGPNITECTSCNNYRGFYSKEDDLDFFCYSRSEILEGYYLNLTENSIRKCNERCLSCSKSGTDTYSNCIKCINDSYHFDPIKSNHCINVNELPNRNYYLDTSDDKYKKCNTACETCYGPYANTCILCNNNYGYYYKENNESQICYSNINIEIGYYLDNINKLYRRCNKRCLKCEEGGSDIESNCLICNNSLNYHFDPYKDKQCLTFEELSTTNYYLDLTVDKFKECHNNCSTCTNPYKCTTCNNTKGYYFIENDYSGYCYNLSTIAIGYYLNLTDKLFKLCNSRCYSCVVGGIDSQSNCTKCKNSNNLHFDPYKLNHCIKFNELPNSSYYLETSLDQYKICHESCLTCTGPHKKNCTSCNGLTFFQTEFYDNQCLKFEEIPIDYYNKSSSGKLTYHKCHISCRTCLEGGVNKCTSCNISGGYYPVEEKPGYCLRKEETPIKYYFNSNEKAIKKCATNCATCTKGFDSNTKEMHCDTCIPYTYFQNTSSTNCIPKPETRYYIDIYNGHETLFPCYPSCLTCVKGGDFDNNNCLSCIAEFYFDDEEPTNCVDDDLDCAIGCAKCYKNTSDPIYGVLSADKVCRRCSHKMGYYPLEKFSNDQFYVSCYPFNKSPLNYIYDETKKYHTLCYKTCKKCFKVGNSLNHSCITCENNYIFIDEEPSNCFPKCKYYYYYNKYKQYKCTENEECPLEYPFLIANKSKCVDNCYSDDEFNLMFKNECFQRCPEGTSSYIYRYNGEFTAKCINADDFLNDKECDLDIIVNKLKYPEITQEILAEYAQDYIHEYPVANSYVTSYLSPDSDTMNKYLIVLYKLEKCPIQKVEGFVPIGLDECIDKVKTKFTITKNLVVQIFYIIRKNTPPQIDYYLYHPDTGEKLDLSICSGAKLAIKTSIFDNGNVNEELVKYFSNLNINIFDQKDPFFTDICFNYDHEGKDVPLADRMKLFYQNITLCEDGCVYVGINLNTYEVECSCEMKNDKNIINEDNIKTLLDNPLSNEVFGVLTNSNIEVLKCIKKAFNTKLIIKNYGGLMMVGIIFVQIIYTVFIKIQMKKVERFIYTFITEIKYPPKRKTFLFQTEKKINMDNFDQELISKASKDVIINDIIPKKIEEENKINNVSKNKVKRNIKNQERNKTHKVIENKTRNNNKLLKKGSLATNSSLLNTKDKYTLVKKGSLQYSTHYTNIISQDKDKNNSPNKSGSELNININKSNNSSDSESGSGSGSGEIGTNRINSGASDTRLYKLDDIIIYNDKNKDNNKNIQLFEEKGKGEGDIKLQKRPSRFKTHINNKENSNNIIKFENGKTIENGMNSGTFRDNIPINDIGFEGNKNISIYLDRQNKNLLSSKQNSNTKKNIDINQTKRKSEDIPINQDINILRKQIKDEIIIQLKEKKKQRMENERIKQLILVPYEHKEYDEKQLNELDYEEAIIYDKRSFCKMLWYSLKERQTLINTFFSQNNLKPISMKLLVLFFSFSCYFVINGFLYNEEYVSQKLENKGNKTFYEYLSDSIERIFYTSVVGGVISFIIGIVFNTEKKIDEVINKYKDNKILLKGEIAKIFRRSKITMLCFIIIQFILMIVFTIYIFCFCYVYPNNKLDWFESSLIVIGIIQILSLFTCFLFTFIKYLGIKFQLEYCFKIISYFEENL